MLHALLHIKVVVQDIKWISNPNKHNYSSIPASLLGMKDIAKMPLG